MKSTVATFFTIVFIVMGVVQFFAVIDFFRITLGWRLIISCAAAAIVAYIPFVGAICGFFGAIYSWGWEWWQSAILFFWWIPLFLLSMATDLINARRY